MDNKIKERNRQKGEYDSCSMQQEEETRKQLKISM